MAIKLIPNWKKVMLRAHVVWVALLATIVEVAIYAAQNMETIQAHVPDQYKFWFRVAVGLLILVLRPVQQTSLHKDSDDLLDSPAAQERSNS